jgi:hypothetical protein
MTKYIVGLIATTRPTCTHVTVYTCDTRSKGPNIPLNIPALCTDDIPVQFNNVVLVDILPTRRCVLVHMF